MAKQITLNIHSNAGYSADQVVDRTITLQDLLEAVQQAVEDHGEDAKIILNEGQTYGANFGYLSPFEELFTTEAVDCEQCGSEIDTEDGTCDVCGFSN